MGQVTLINKTKRPPRALVLNLDRNIEAVKVTNRTREESRDGTRRVRVRERLVPGSLRIAAGGKVEVDEKVLGSAEVARAIEAGDIAVVEEQPDKGAAGSAGPKRRRRV